MERSSRFEQTLISLQMPTNGLLKMIALSMSEILSISRNGARDNERKRQGKRMMQKKAESLLEKLHERIAAAPPAKVSQPHPLSARPAIDSIVRESHIRMITSLRKYFRPMGMELIVNQALVGKRHLDDLSDDELLDLMHAIDRARECIREGICFEEAGLIRPDFK